METNISCLRYHIWVCAVIVYLLHCVSLIYRQFRCGCFSHLAVCSSSSHPSTSCKEYILSYRTVHMHANSLTLTHTHTHTHTHTLQRDPDGTQSGCGLVLLLLLDVELWRDGADCDPLEGPAAPPASIPHPRQWTCGKNTQCTTYDKHT